MTLQEIIKRAEACDKQFPNTQPLGLIVADLARLVVAELQAESRSA